MSSSLHETPLAFKRPTCPQRAAAFRNVLIVSLTMGSTRRMRQEPGERREAAGCFRLEEFRKSRSKGFPYMNSTWASQRIDIIPAQGPGCGVGGGWQG
jgi:hypothetical protein